MYQFLPISTIEAVLKLIVGLTPGIIFVYIVKVLSIVDDKPISIKKQVAILGIYLLASAALLFFPHPSQIYKMQTDDVVMVQSGPSQWPFQRQYPTHYYRQVDTDLTATEIVELRELPKDVNHPPTLDWVKTNGVNVLGIRTEPKGYIIGLKHGDPATDWVQITYQIGKTRYVYLVHLSTEDFLELVKVVSDNPIPATLEGNQLILSHYH